MSHLLGEKRFIRIGGMLYQETARNVFDENAEQRDTRLSKEYKHRGFRFAFKAYT
jgi:hypothetical protein